MALASSPVQGRGLLLCIALTLGLAACGGEGQAAAPQGAPAGRGRGDGAPVPVTTASVVEKSMPVIITAVGTAEAISTVQVRSQVTGRLAQVHLAEGQDVDKGQLLFTIDPQPFQVTLDQASAILARDTAQANNAQVQAERYDNLFKRGLVPRDQYETQVAAAAALKATTAADEAAVAAARLNLEYTRIVAPAAGRTGALLVHEGDLVQANVNTPLVVINQMAPIYVSFPVPGKALDDIRRFQGTGALVVGARTSGEQEGEETGKLTFIDNAVDPQTGTIKLKATFGNAARRLWPGQFAEVMLQMREEPRALVVPSVAVQAGQQGSYVFVVDDGRAQMRPVTVTRVVGDESVIGSGLAAGDVVVTDGQLRLTPNARIAQRGTGAAGRSGRAGAEAQ